VVSIKFPINTGIDPGATARADIEIPAVLTDMSRFNIMQNW
jgi:hypothetical protein